MASTSQTVANAPQTTLAALCNAGDTSISVLSSAGYPSTGPYTLLIENEYLLVTSGFGTTTWGVSRAQEGTSAVSHAASTPVYLEFTKATLDSFGGGYWPFLQPSGMGSAIQQTRWVGGQTVGAPTSGTFAIGDIATDLTGQMWVCTVAGTPGTWRYGATKWKCRAYMVAAQNSINGADTLLNLDTIDFDPNNNFSTSTHLYTVPVTGYYMVACNTNVGSTAANQVNQSKIIKAAGAAPTGNIMVGTTNWSTATAEGLSSLVSGVQFLTAGDTIGLNTFTNAILVLTSNTIYYNYFSIHFLSPP